MLKDLQVAKSNYLVEASYKLTLQEQRLILACLSKINSKIEPPKTITLSASEYSDIMNIDIKNAHRELNKAAGKLYERSITVSDPEKTEEFRWIQKKVIYHKGDGKVTITWSDDVLTYIGQLKSRFTSYKIRNISSFQSTYSIRLYELLMQFNSTKERTISLDDFRSLFKINDKYLKFKDLNRDVIKPSIKEINNVSDLVVCCSPIKKGRNIVALIFDFKQNNQMKINFP